MSAKFTPNSRLQKPLQKTTPLQGSTPKFDSTPCFSICLRKLLSIYVFGYLPFGFEHRIWDLIVSVPDHCLSFYSVNFNSHFFLFAFKVGFDCA